jgi:hypothetical protein
MGGVQSTEAGSSPNVNANRRAERDRSPRARFGHLKGIYREFADHAAKLDEHWLMPTDFFYAQT